MFGSLLKAAVGVVIETPLAVAKDVVTLGGSITNEREPATLTALRRVAQNVNDATTPESDK